MFELLKYRLKETFAKTELLLGLFVTLIAAVAWFGGWFANDALFAASVVVGAVGAGKHVDGEPLTTTLTNDESPDLLRNEIDRRVVKIRPMSTPLDQISRFGGSRPAGSMVVDYYSVDTRPTETKIAVAFEADDREPQGASVNIQTENDAILQPSTTLMLPTVLTNDGSPLVLYVTKKEGDGVNVMAVNNLVGGRPAVPSLPVGTKVIRMGRAAAELDVMTAQFEVLPTKSSNNCQIFKAQVEQSTFMKIANKEVGWTFSDQEEAAIIDMRQGMEKNYLFGVKNRIVDPYDSQEVLLTGGIWGQTDNCFTYTAATPINEEWMVKLCRQAFSHNAGSSKKVLLAGSDLIEKLHLAGAERTIGASEHVTKWGLDFNQIHSKFGTLYVLLAEVFDHCGMPGAGMVIDPEYITKYSHVPFRTERLNLRKSGLRNVDAVVITEASCLVLRYPQSHMKIVMA